MAVKRQARHGFFRQTISIPFAIAAGTSAEEAITDWLPGFAGTVESVGISASMVAAAGSGASRGLSLVRTRGSTDVTMASVTAALADLGKGAVKALTLSTTVSELDFVDDDKFSIMVAANGTQFTAFTGVMLIVARSKPQQQ